MPTRRPAWLYHFPLRREWPGFAASPPAFGIVAVFNSSPFDKCVVTSHCGFCLRFLLADDAQYLFTSFFSVCTFSSVKRLPVWLARFPTGSCCFVLLSFDGYLHILDQVFVRYVVCKYFLQNWSCFFFNPFHMTFLGAKVLIFMKFINLPFRGSSSR